MPESETLRRKLSSLTHVVFFLQRKFVGLEASFSAAGKRKSPGRRPCWAEVGLGMFELLLLRARCWLLPFRMLVPDGINTSHARNVLAASVNEKTLNKTMQSVTRKQVLLDAQTRVVCAQANVVYVETNVKCSNKNCFYSNKCCLCLCSNKCCLCFPTSVVYAQISVVDA